MDVFDSRYFNINKFILSFIGQWVYQSKLSKLFARTTIFLTLSTALIPQFNFFISSLGNDIDATFECLPPLFLILLCWCHIILFSVKSKTLIYLAETIRNDWKFWSSTKESEILKTHAETGRFYSILYCGNVYAAVFMFVSMSMTPIVLDLIVPLNETRPRQLVYAAKYPINEEKYFKWLLLHGSVTAFCNLSVLFGCDALLAATTQHVCGIFSVVSYRLKNILNVSDDEVNSQGKSSEDRIYNEINFCIDWHNHALGYAKTLDSIFSPYLFFTVGLNVITLSLLGIQTLNSTANLDQTIKYGAFGCACLIHLYCISLPAQNLQDCSTEVADKAFSGPWYEVPNKSRKLFISIISRSQIPSKLNAGKICSIDMISFSALVKTSVSYFTVLSSMQ